MRTIFTKQYLLQNKECYKAEQVEAIPFTNNEITLRGLFNHLPVKDFAWFLVHKCELTNLEKKLFALYCAEFSAHIYKKKYPNDNRVDACLQATREYLSGGITREVLMEMRACTRFAADDAFADNNIVATDAAAFVAFAATVADDDTLLYNIVAHIDYTFKKHVWKFIEQITE